MFLPFDTSISMWFATIPRFDWVPAPAPPAPPEGTCGSDSGEAEGAAGGAGGAPATHLHMVFNGFDWTVFRMWHAVPNAAWELCVENKRDEDEAHIQERSHHAHRPLAADAAGPGVAPDGVQADDAGEDPVR
jgi:hypothetical protein